jgi:hypothetical protein
MFLFLMRMAWVAYFEPFRCVCLEANVCLYKWELSSHKDTDDGLLGPSADAEPSILFAQSAPTMAAVNLQQAPESATSTTLALRRFMTMNEVPMHHVRRSTMPEPLPDFELEAEVPETQPIPELLASDPAHPLASATEVLNEPLDPSSIEFKSDNATNNSDVIASMPGLRRLHTIHEGEFDLDLQIPIPAFTELELELMQERADALQNAADVEQDLQEEFDLGQYSSRAFSDADLVDVLETVPETVAMADVSVNPSRSTSHIQHNMNTRHHAPTLQQHLHEGATDRSLHARCAVTVSAPIFFSCWMSHH